MNPNQQIPLFSSQHVTNNVSEQYTDVHLQVEECMTKLMGLSLNSREIGKQDTPSLPPSLPPTLTSSPPPLPANILNHAPLLACVPLSDASVSTVQQFLQHSGGTSCVQPMLLHTLVSGLVKGSHTLSFAIQLKCCGNLICSTPIQCIEALTFFAFVLFLFSASLLSCPSPSFPPPPSPPPPPSSIVPVVWS